MRFVAPSPVSRGLAPPRVASTHPFPAVAPIVTPSLARATTSVPASRAHRPAEPPEHLHATGWRVVGPPGRRAADSVCRLGLGADTQSPQSTCTSGRLALSRLESPSRFGTLALTSCTRARDPAPVRPPGRMLRVSRAVAWVPLRAEQPAASRYCPAMRDPSCPATSALGAQHQLVKHSVLYKGSSSQQPSQTGEHLNNYNIQKYLQLFHIISNFILGIIGTH